MSVNRGVGDRAGDRAGVRALSFFLRNAVLGLGLGLVSTLTLTLKKHSLCTYQCKAGGGEAGYGVGI